MREFDPGSRSANLTPGVPNRHTLLVGVLEASRHSAAAEGFGNPGFSCSAVPLPDSNFGEGPACMNPCQADPDSVIISARLCEA